MRLWWKEKMASNTFFLETFITKTCHPKLCVFVLVVYKALIQAGVDTFFLAAVHVFPKKMDRLQVFTDWSQQLTKLWNAPYYLHYWLPRKAKPENLSLFPETLFKVASCDDICLQYQHSEEKSEESQIQGNPQVHETPSPKKDDQGWWNVSVDKVTWCELVNSSMGARVQSSEPTRWK